MLQKLRFFYLNIKYGLINIWLWFPIIWTDRNWDFCYIYRILRHKLKLTRTLIEKHGIHANKKRDIKNIRIAELLLERLEKDEYFWIKFETKEWLSWSPAEKKRDYELCKKRYEYDKRFLFEHLRKHIDKWWN